MTVRSTDRSSSSEALRPSSAWRTVGGVLLATLGCLVVLEIVLRILPVDLDWRPIEIRYAKNARHVSELNSRHFVPADGVRWAPKPGEPPFNAHGYRGELLPRVKPADEFRILALGDSNTLGHKEAWPNLLPAELDPSVFGKRRVRVINAGVYGYSSFQGRLRLASFLDYQPDLVLISFAGNDPTPSATEDKAYGVSRHPLFRWFDDRSAIIQLVEWLVTRRVRDRETVAAKLGARVSVADYRANVIAMKERSEAAGARVIVMTRPQTVYTPEQYPYYEATLALADSLPVIDVYRMAAQAWSLYQDFSHFSAFGHRTVAPLIARAIEAIWNGQAASIDELRYTPSPEILFTDRMRAQLGAWGTADEAVAHVLGDPMVLRSHVVLDEAFSDGKGRWRVGDYARRDGTARVVHRGGKMCVEVDKGFPVILDPGLRLDPAHSHFVWVETDPSVRADVAIRWYRGEQESNVADNLGPERPRAVTTLVPSGVESLMFLVVPKIRPGAVCLKRLRIDALETAPFHTFSPVPSQVDAPMVRSEALGSGRVYRTRTPMRMAWPVTDGCWVATGDVSVSEGAEAEISAADSVGRSEEALRVRAAPGEWRPLRLTLLFRQPGMWTLAAHATGDAPAEVAWRGFKLDRVAGACGPR